MGHLLIFDISGGELVVILVFILLFFGSKGIPGIARTMGRTMRQIRDASAEVQREIQKETHVVKKGFDEQRRGFALEEPAPPPAPSVTPPPSAGDQPPAEGPAS